MEDLCVIGQLDIFILEDLRHYRSVEKYNFFDKLNGREWAHIFYQILGCSTFNEFVSEGRNIEDSHKMYKENFIKTTSDFPMLQKLEDIYKNVLFNPEQIIDLKDEITRILDKAKEDEYAYAGLSKLLKASDAAIEDKSYLILDSW